MNDPSLGPARCRGSRRSISTVILLPLILVVALASAAPAFGAASGQNGRIAFTHQIFGGGLEVFSTAPDGTDLQPDGPPLPANTSSGRGPWTSVSPDGEHLAIETSFNGTTGLGVIDLTTGVLGPRLTPDNMFPHTFAQIGWSPDGTTLAFSAEVTPGTNHYGLFTVPADGSSQPQMVVPPGASGLPTDDVLDVTWSGSGQEIVFVHQHSQLGGFGSQIQAIRPDSTGLRDITPLSVSSSPPGLHGLNVAGDDSRLAYFDDLHTRPVDTRQQLKVVSFSGGTPATVVSQNDLLNDRPLAFAPQGDQIAYERLVDSSGPGGSSVAEIRVVDAGGTNDHRVFFDSQHAPQWLGWLPSGVAVIIASGPSGPTRETSPTFVFGAAGAPPGHLECALDTGSFATCTSPFTTPALQDGPHTFRVRYAPDGKPPGSASTRTFIVDTMPPTAVIDSGPPAGGALSDASFTFHSTEPAGAGFLCATDGQPAAACTSPAAVAGLGPGTHTFAVQAIDAAGNVQSNPTTRSFRVGSSGPAVVAARCNAPAVSKVAFGPIVAIAPTTDACFTVEHIGGRDVRVARAAIFVNGLKVSPVSGGTRIIVDGILGNGTVRSTGPVTVGVGRYAIEQRPLELDALATGSIVKATTKLNDILSKLSGLKLFSAPTLEFSKDNGGQTKVRLTVSLPELFTALPASSPHANGQASPGGLTGEFGAVASNDLGVFYTGKATISELWLFGKISLKNLTLAFDQSTGTLEGSVGLALSKGAVQVAGVDPSATLTATISIAPEGVIGNLRKLSLAASDLQIHIGDGFFLQRISGTLDRGTDHGDDVAIISLAGGASFGKRIEVKIEGRKVFKGEAISIDGTGSLKIPIDPSGRAFQLSVTGTGKVVDIPLINEGVTYSRPGGIDLTGSLDYTIGGYGFKAGIDHAFFDPASDTFSIEASGEVRLPFGITQGAQVIVSSVGYAACFQMGDINVGFTQTWQRDLDPWTDSCDVGPFRNAPHAADAAASSRIVRIARGTRAAVIAVRGNGGAPKLTVTPPKGAPIASGDDLAALRRRHILLVEDMTRNVTTLVVAHPAPGAWRIEPHAGSTIAGVRLATGLPPVRVHARVVGTGKRRSLTWSAKGLAGHTLTLVEEGRGGSARRLRTTRRARGKIAFTPSPVIIGAQRRVEAIVARRGIVRTTDVVARYRFAATTPGRTTSVRRRGVVLSWRAVPGASAYAVAVQPRTGTTFIRTVTKPALRLPAALRRGAVVVRIVALDAAGRAGRPATAVFKR
jgi:hypothetical protein